MPVNRGAVLARTLEPLEFRLTQRDCMLYALSLGLNADPMNRDELLYTYEQNLRVFPTMAVSIGHSYGWLTEPELGLSAEMIVHGAERLTCLKPLTPNMRLVSGARVLNLFDKGEGRGAILVIEKTLADSRSGELVARMESLIFARGDGGHGGDQGSARPFKKPPASPPDLTIAIETSPNAALLFRLNGDLNPLHADPDFAVAGGFERPILHGLCTFGIAGVALRRASRESGDWNLASIEARFCSPVVPGETITFDLWRAGDEILFRGRVAERDVVVLDGGSAKLR